MANKKYNPSVQTDIDWTKFKENLALLMRTRGMTAADLSKAVHISASSFSRLITTDRTPDLTTAYILAEHFDVSIDWLLGRVEGRYDDFDEEKRLIASYKAARPEDRQAIDCILSKYAKA